MQWKGKECLHHLYTQHLHRPAEGNGQQTTGCTPSLFIQQTTGCTPSLFIQQTKMNTNDQLTSVSSSPLMSLPHCPPLPTIPPPSPNPPIISLSSSSSLNNLCCYVYFQLSIHNSFCNSITE